MKNPWLGLASYTERDVTSENGHGFYGRSESIAVLASMIRRNLFVTLYGRSGIGKTSLLQAGVFPVLRREGFAPVVIRFNAAEKGNYAGYVWKTLIGRLSSAGITYVSDDESYTPDFGNVNVLRELFAAGKFRSESSNEMTPVLVFDQFEELLYRDRLGASTFISQLYSLIDDNITFDVVHPDWNDDTNFRIVISIREDDLFMLEDVVDSLNLTDLKSNRYRLRPLDAGQAREVILGPASEIIAPDDRTEVADEIIRMSTDETSGQINTLRLSLLCYVLFNEANRRGSTITVNDIRKHSDTLETHYLEVVRDLPKADRYFLEDNLVDPEGRRKFIYTRDLDSHPALRKLLDDSNYRILNEDQGRIELVHDQLAATIARLRIQRKRRYTRVIGVSALVLSLIVLLLVSLSFYPGGLEKSIVDDDGVIELCNNWVVERFSTDMNIPRDYTIKVSDCPNLKTIDINSTKQNIYIVNCPNLVMVNVPERFNGSLTYDRCPNLVTDIHNCIGKLCIDSILPAYASEHVVIPNYFGSLKKEIYERYDSLSHELYFYGLPNVYVLRNIDRYVHPLEVGLCVKKITGLSDSLKRISTCYVPFGYKDYYMSLVQFQPFKEIRELPVYCTWLYHFEDILRWTKYGAWWTFVLAGIGLLFVMCFFWFVSYSSRSEMTGDRTKDAVHSFLYGLGMTGLALLAFMAFYWLFFDIITPYDSIWPSIAGAVGSVLCLGVVYRNLFYAAYRFINRNGFWNSLILLSEAVSRLFKWMYASILRHWKWSLTVIVALLLVALGITIYRKQSGLRKFWLNSLYELVDLKQYNKAIALSDELLDRVNRPFFSEFADSVQSVRTRLTADSVALAALVDFETINAITCGYKMPDKVGLQEILAINHDGNKICLQFSHGSNNGFAVLLDLKSMTIDSICSNYSYSADFSPSGRMLFISNEPGKILRYDLQSSETAVVDISEKLPDGIRYWLARYITAVNDSVVYYTSYSDQLYRAVFDGKSGGECVDSALEVIDIYRIDGSVLGIMEPKGFIIYDYVDDTVVDRIETPYLGGKIKYFDRDMCIGSRGLFDFKQDSLYVGYDYYRVFNRPVTTDRDRNKIYIKSIAGDTVKVLDRCEIPVSNVFIVDAESNYLFNKSGNSFAIYNLNNDRHSWTLTEEERKRYKL